MPACLSRLPCVSFEILSVVHPRATAWPSLHGKASHGIFSRLWLPTNSVRLPPLKGAQGLAPRFFTSFRMTAPAGRLHGAWRLPSFPAPMTPMQHRLPVISTGVEKSHPSMVQAALGQEISRLRVSIDSKHICPRSGTQPRSR